MSEKIIQDIKAGRYGREELGNLCSNAERLRKEDVLLAAKGALKEIDSRSYAKRFIKPIREKVQQIATDIASAEGWGAWDGNTVENGVKAGAPMTNGDELAEYYFSYRNASWKSASSLAVFQHDEDSSVQYKVKLRDGEVRIVKTSGEAIDLFRTAISA